MHRCFVFLSVTITEFTLWFEVTRKYYSRLLCPSHNISHERILTTTKKQILWGQYNVRYILDDDNASWDDSRETSYTHRVNSCWGCGNNARTKQCKGSSEISIRGSQLEFLGTAWSHSRIEIRTYTLWIYLVLFMGLCLITTTNILLSKIN